MSDVLPQGWVKTTLDELGVEAQSGFASGSHNRDGKGILHLRPMNITREGTLDLSNARYVLDESNRRVQDGDILFNNTNSPALTGKTTLVRLPSPAAYSNHMTRLRVPEGVDAAFMAHQLHSLWRSGYFLSILQNHVNQASVAKAALLRTPVMLPPLAEQRRIVEALEDHLSHLEAGCRGLEQVKVRSDAYVSRLLQSAVEGRIQPVLQVDPVREQILSERSRIVTGRRSVPRAPAVRSLDGACAQWETMSVDEISWNIEYGTSSKAHSDPVATSVPVVRMGNIKDRRIVLDSVKYLDTDHEDVRRLMLQDGDLLFNRTNSAELVGKCAVYREGLGPATFASYLIRCQLVPGVEPDWVKLVISSSAGRRYLNSIVSQQVGQANINGTKLATMPIPIPPLGAQRAILETVERGVEASERLKSEACQALERAGRLRTALLSKAFSGQLIPQDPTDEPAAKLLARIEAERVGEPKVVSTRRLRTGAPRPVPSEAQGELPL